MPELPEVETVRRGLQPIIVGQKIVEVKHFRDALRFPFPERFEERIRGTTIKGLDRRAKYLLAELTSGEILIIHLGMSGRFTIEHASYNGQPWAFVHATGTNSKHDHVIIQMENGALLRYNDARRFGFMDIIAEQAIQDHKFFRSLGVEPLSENLTPDFLASKAQNRNTSLKSFLMDQRIIAGLGNIYVCEALFRAGLSPKRKSSTLTTAKGRAGERAKELVNAIKAVLDEAIDAGGSTLRDHRQTDGSLGYFQHSFSVYAREGEACASPECNAMVRRIAQNGRSTFYCPQCQR